MGTITLDINGLNVYFMSIHYTKSHPSPDPDTFELVLTPDEGDDVDYFDQVTIKKDGVIEFVGFVEEITPEIGEDGLEYSITGRCWKLILWKKYCQRFQESRDVGPDDLTADTSETGFFGKVYPNELIKFLLRCTTSTTPLGKVRQKIGWGICSDLWSCCANPTAEGSDPQWVALRYSELSWRSRSEIYNIFISDLVVNAFDSTYTDWYTFGVSPWLDIDDDLGGYISTTYKVGLKSEGCFTFASIDPSAIGVYTVYLKVKQRCNFYLDPDYCKIWLWDGTSWFELDFPTTYFWSLITIDVSTILDSPAKVNSAKIYFKANCGTVPVSSSIEITYAYLNVQWTTTDLGASIMQKAGDYFIVDLGEPYDDVTAILIECRNNENNFAVNYNIKYCTFLSGCCSAPEGDWNDFNDLGSPIDVTHNAARDILHSWKPQDDVECIRIKITASADQPWEISQIYVWQADDSQYRVMDE